MIVTRTYRGRRPGIIVTLVALVSFAALGLGGCARGNTAQRGAAPTATQSYGGLATYLPTNGVVADSVLTGTAERPALTTQGDAVRVVLPTGAVTVTVTGPQVPGEGLPKVTSATTCTWTIALAEATAPMAIPVSAFTTVDHLGAIFRPLPVPGKPGPQSIVRPGQRVTYELRAVMPTGEGLMRLSPLGGRIVAAWDFEVEND